MRSRRRGERMRGEPPRRGARAARQAEPASDVGPDPVRRAQPSTRGAGRCWRGGRYVGRRAGAPCSAEASRQMCAADCRALRARTTWRSAGAPGRRSMPSAAARFRVPAPRPCNRRARRRSSHHRRRRRLRDPRRAHNRPRTRGPPRRAQTRARRRRSRTGAAPPARAPTTPPRPEPGTAGAPWGMRRSKTRAGRDRRGRGPALGK